MTLTPSIRSCHRTNYSQKFKQTNCFKIEMRSYNLNNLVELDAIVSKLYIFLSKWG